VTRLIDSCKYFWLSEVKEIDVTSIPPSAVQLLKKSDHGTITSFADREGWLPGVWRYLPDEGYEGGDTIEFLVDVQGMPVRVLCVLKVTRLDFERDIDVHESSTQ
jgi:hypothetical protein